VNIAYLRNLFLVDESNISENVRKATEMLENIMLTAEEQNWSRCPQCKNMVEKNVNIKLIKF
jgi:uncharacterized protein with PIN domain